MTSGPSVGPQSLPYLPPKLNVTPVVPSCTGSSRQSNYTTEMNSRLNDPVDRPRRACRARWLVRFCRRPSGSFGVSLTVVALLHKIR